ncbi:MAG: hypothetical protein ACRCSL_16525 [Microbacterium sp.]
MIADVIEGGLAAFADGVDTHDPVVLCAALQVYGAALRAGRDVPRPLRRALAAAADADLLAAYWLSEGSQWHEHLLVGWYRVRIEQGRSLGEGLPAIEVR